ncbi:response regulator [Puteibacter caeruleilacunae]|nr:response regulator [Puteibacter caeruleilacunae]
MKLLFSIILSVFLFSQVQGITVRFEKIESYDAFSEELVNTIYQGNDGFLWIATEKGLNRYDGFQYAPLYGYPQDQEIKSADKVRYIFSEDNQRYLLITGDGCFSMNASTREVVKIETPVFQDSIQCARQTVDREVYFGNAKGLFTLVDKEAKKLWDGDVRDIAFEGKRLVYFITADNHLYKFNRVRNKVIDTNVQLPSNDEILSCWYGSSNELWLGTASNGVYVVELNTMKLRHHEIPFFQNEQFPVTSIETDRNNNIWLGTLGGGLIRVIQDGGITFEQYALDLERIDGLYSNEITCLFKDQSGLLWMGTNGNGISKVIIETSNAELIGYDRNNPNSLSYGEISSVIVDRNQAIWVGTRGGGLNQIIFDEKHEKYQVNHFTKENSGLKSNYISCLKEDPFGNLWIGTWGGGICRISKDDNGNWKYKNYYQNEQDSTSISSYNILSIYIDRKTRMWIGTAHGLNLYDFNTDQFEWGTEKLASLRRLKGSRHLVAIEEGANDLWFGTRGGFYRFEERADTMIRFHRKSKDFEWLFDDHVLCMKSDFPNMWVGTDQGLQRLNMLNNEYGFVQDSTFSVNLKIRSIELDDFGRLWLGTDKGLYVYKKSSGTYHHVEISGKKQLEFNRGSFADDQQERIYFSTKEGILSYEPASLELSSYRPNIAITGITIDGEYTNQNSSKADGQGEDVAYSDVLNFKSGIKLIELSARVLDFNHPEANKIAYQIEGWNQHWNYLQGKDQSINLHNLPYGEYILKLKATNSQGIWMREHHAIRLAIAPPIWLTWYAWLTYLFILTVSFLIFRRLYERRKELQQQYRDEAFKTEFFANISHEFRTPLSLILGPAEEMKGGLPEDEYKRYADIILRNAKRLYRLINQLLDYNKSSNVISDLKVKEENLVDLIHEIYGAFTQYAKSRSITYELNLKEVGMGYIDRDKLETVLINLLSNAFKFTENEGTITMNVSQDDGKLKVSLKDTGRGLSPDEIDKVFERYYQAEKSGGGYGIGLALSRKLMDLHHGGIHVESQKGQYTLFSIELPVSRDAFAEDEILEMVAIEDTASIISNIDDMLGNMGNERYKLLLVDDNKDIRDFLEKLLKNHFDLQLAEDGQQALAVMENYRPDLIISDVMMPVMDGYEFCQKVKANFETSHIPVILLTAKTTVADQVEGFEYGADAYVLKPFEPKLLLARVKSLLRNREEIKQRFQEGGVYSTKSNVQSADDKFIKKMIDTIQENLTDPEFNVNNLVKEMAVSRTLLHMKVKEILGLTTGELIRKIRMQKAAELILQQDMNIAEVAYACGFNDPKYFSRMFKSTYGMTPTEYAGTRKEA